MHVRDLDVFDIRYESLISANYHDRLAIACDRQARFVWIEPQHSVRRFMAIYRDTSRGDFFLC